MNFLNNRYKINNISNSLNFLSIFNLPQILKIYWYSTIEILFNIFNIHKTEIVKNNFNFKYLFNYFVSSIYISIIILLPVLYSATGDLGKITYLLRILVGFVTISFLYSCILLITKKKFLFKEIFFIMVLLYSFMYPILYVFSLPIFLSMQEFNVDFILGGNSSFEVKFLNDNIYFLYYVIFLPHLMFLLTTTINIIWFKKILHIKYWESILCFCIVNLTLLPYFLKELNPTILFIIKKLDRIFNLVEI